MNTFKGKSILVVTSDFIYPPNHGGRVDVWNKILCLRSLGFNIDLIATIKENPSEKNLMIVRSVVDNLILVYRKNKIIDVFSFIPLQIKSRVNLKYINFDKKYDYISLEGTYVVSILENESLKVKHKMLRMQNDEAVYFRQLANSEKTYWKKFYYFTEALKFKFIDKKIVNNMSNIMFISYEELNKYKNKYKDINGYFMPAAIEMKIKKQILNTKNVVCIGSLFMVNNKEAVQFYIEKIHPLLNDIKEYTFTIAGNSKGEGIEWIKKLASNYSNINIIDSPESLDDIYANASVFVNPMLHGAGVKLKTVNAIVNGLPVVSTTIGNQGTGLEHGKHIYVADEPEKFAEYVRMLLNSKEKRQKIVKDSQKYIQLYYDQEKILSKYLDEIGRS
ncbi:glycosyltransferase family 4 protein [Megamonas hypermegale]|uniref:glycosyltransferase family 4 protein n=1 Tax=Megamonas hypermegale TaxID=158847 RepID=UPI0026EAF326|nr:glycosyltransferase family 4 protein [Megamonas hypermegale]